MTEFRYYSRTPQLQDGICAVVAAVATACSAWWYVGPYRWFAEAEMSSFGSYEVKLTLLLTFFLGYAAVRALALQMSQFQSDIEQRPTKPLPSVYVSSSLRLLTSRVGRGVIVSATILIAAGYQYVVAVSAGPLRQVSLESMESGMTPLPAGRWWELQGTPLFDEAQTWMDGAARVHYVPVVSATWRQATPVAVVLVVKDIELDRLRRAGTTLSGIAELSGLSPLVAAHWQSRNAPVGPSTVAIAYGASPTEKMLTAEVIGGVGATMLAGLLLWQAVSARRRGER